MNKINDIDRLKSLRRVESHIREKILKIEQSLIDKHRIEIEEKGHGSVSIGNLEFKIPKYVKWDQDGLQMIVDEIDRQGGNVHDYIGMKLLVNETKYNNFPHAIRTKFDECRTVTTGKIAVKVKED